VELPKVDTERCKGCALCVEFCPFQRLELSGELSAAGYHPVVAGGPDLPGEAAAFTHNFAFWCPRCRYCELICPDAAIGLPDLGSRDGGERIRGAAGDALVRDFPPLDTANGTARRVPLGERLLMKGNEALAEAAIKAGCRAYFGYPITPASEIAAYMAAHLPAAGGVFLQSESEVAAINMTFGAAGTGARAMTATSSPGLSLMSEGVSFLSAAELPCLMVDVMRVGPGLGGIQPSQSDYHQVTRGLGHGGARVIVLAPATVQEMVDLVFDAYELAEHYRIPALILADGILGQMMEPVTFKRELDPTERRQSTWTTTGARGRESRVITSLYLDSAKLDAHNRKLLDKLAAIERTEPRWREYGPEKADILLVAYGTVARVSRHAIGLREDEDACLALFRPLTLYPFPREALRRVVEERQVQQVLVVEMSGGQLVEDVRLAVEGSRPVELLSRVGGVVPTPREVLNATRALSEGGRL
jgi:2-oxoglutarate/2-oxoacid ferredoxin oxidoreductase subunit alpha